MKRTLILALLILLAIPLVANADGADIWRRHVVIPFNEDVTGCGTTVHIEGTLHLFMQSVDAPGGSLLEKWLYNTQGLQGTDLDGNAYRVVWHDSGQLLDHGETIVERFLLIGQGDAPNIMIGLTHSYQSRGADIDIRWSECR